MIVDTGASACWIDTSLATTLKPVDHSKVKVTGLLEDSEKDLAIVAVDRIESGSVTFRSQRMLVASIHETRRTQTGSNIGSPTDHEFDIILGMDFLQTNHSILHVAGNKLYIRGVEPDKKLTAVIRATLIASGWSEASLAAPTVRNRLYLSPQINGHLARLLVDTGAGFTFMDSRQISDLGLGKREVIGTVAGVGNKKGDLNFTKVDSFTIAGAANLTNVRVGIIDLRHTNQSEYDLHMPPIQGLLGPELLHKWVALIDCSAPAIYLRKDLIAK
jgi:predicted aspartyl protease